MIKNIQQFYEKDILNLKKIVEKFASNPMNQADFIYGITDCVVSFGQNLIVEMLESMDESIRKDGHRRLSGLTSPCAIDGFIVNHEWESLTLRIN